ncbi:MAG: 30S ribosomal protein S5 [bacterium]
MFNQRDFDTKLVDIARVTRVVAGGKRFRFRTVVVIGDRKGSIGLAVGKGPDVSSAMEKAIAKAKKDLIKADLVNGTILRQIAIKYRSAKIILKPRKDKLVAGGVIRVMAHLAGIRSMTAKMLGSQNKLNNAQAMMLALKKLKKYAITPIKNKIKEEE